MGEEKLCFPLLKSVTRQKASLGQSASTNFVAIEDWLTHLNPKGQFNTTSTQYQLTPNIQLSLEG